MRPLPTALALCLLLSACTQQASRPAKEAVAEAKGAASEAKETAQQVTADAKTAAHEAATAVGTTAHQVQEGAASAAAEAEGAVNSANRAVQQGVSRAAESTRQGAAQVAQGVREVGEGGVVTGRVSAFSPFRLALQADSSGPAVLRVDGRTRYLLTAAALERGGLAAGTRVRATYVVEAKVPVATEVEVLHP